MARKPYKRKRGSEKATFYTTHDLIQEINAVTGIPIRDVRDTLNHAFVLVETNLKAGKLVHLRNFGTFYRKMRRGYVNNPFKRGARRQPDMWIGKWRPCDRLKRAMHLPAGHVFDVSGNVVKGEEASDVRG